LTLARIEAASSAHSRSGALSVSSSTPSTIACSSESVSGGDSAGVVSAVARPSSEPASEASRERGAPRLLPSEELDSVEKSSPYALSARQYAVSAAIASQPPRESSDFIFKLTCAFLNQ